jgi:hypothetical protein
MQKKVGGDIVSLVDRAVGGLPELHLRTLRGKKYNYCGPGTKLGLRLNDDGTPKDFSKPINKIDEICMHHDYSYKLADDGVGSRRDADKVMLDELNALSNKELNWNEYLAKYFTKGVIGLKYKLGLGIELANELHKPIRRKFKRRRVIVYDIDEIWSADLMDKQKISRYNKGFKYILTVIDVMSKYAYAIPLKSKSSKSIISAFHKLFQSSKRKPQKLWTDQGNEFLNSSFKQLLEDNNIDLYHIYNEGKACVIERFNRTLGEMIARHMTSNKTKNYINILQKLIDEYNNRYHASIKMTPFDASKRENRAKVLRNLYPVKPYSAKPKFKIGDRVRIYKWKNIFEKGSTENWTKEIFIVTAVKNTYPVTYKIKDLHGEDILGSFYSQELQKTIF